MIFRKSENRYEVRSELRGGKGELGFYHIMEKEDTLGKANMLARLTIEPGCSIGEHPHMPEAEIYYILSGEVVVTDNGAEAVLRAGDMMFTGNGDTHSVENRSGETAEFLAFILA